MSEHQPEQPVQGAPQLGPYGQPGLMPVPYPPPIPPHRGGKGRAIAIAAGAVVVVGALVGGALFFTMGEDDKASYAIEMPQTLLDGQYKKEKEEGGGESKGDPFSAKDRADMRKYGIEAAGNGSDASYANSDRQRLAVIAMSGRIPDPKKTLDAMFDEMTKSKDDTLGERGARTETVTRPTEFHPDGLDGAVLKCKSDRTPVDFGSATGIPPLESSMCLWVDGSTLGMVMSDNMNGLTGKKAVKAMSAAELAEATAKVRGEVRKKK
ncbi:hypothetical protein [Streptomyces sp. NPDC002537]